MIPMAYAPEPVDDEPLDGWLERIAQATRTQRALLLRDRNLPAERWQSPVRDFEASDYTRLTELTDVPTERLQQMTFQRWYHLGLAPRRDTRGHQGGAWARTNLYRHCPKCLIERDGIHRIHWRVVWSFACVRHAMILASSDPTYPPYGRPRPLLPAVPLPNGHIALRAQATIDRLLDEAAGTTVPSLGLDRSGWEYLSDLGALARVAVNLSDFEGRDGVITRLHARCDSDWSAVGEDLPGALRSKTPAQRLGHALESPALTAVASVLAFRVLECTTPSAAAGELWWMPDGSRNELMWHAASRGASFPLWDALTRLGGNTQRRSLFLKRFHLTSRDEHGRLLSPIDPTKVPATCWDSVVKSSTSRPREIESAAASAGLLMIGSERTVGEALDRLGLTHLRSRIQHDWNEAFAPTESGNANYAYLLELHRVLTAASIPIDYARRRRVFSRPTPLGRNTRNRVHKALGTRDTPLMGHYLSWYLHELLTGSAWLLSADAVDLPGGLRFQYRRWREGWNAAQPRIIFELAEEALYHNNIDEPVTWRPERQNGLWVVPPDEGRRHLDLWAGSNRPRRQSARLTESELGGYSLADTVALASTAAGPVAEVMRRDLLRFDSVVRHGSITRGAHALGVTPGTLGAAVTRFEARLGQQLLDRATNPAALTPAGRRLVALMNECGFGPTHAVREGLES